MSDTCLSCSAPITWAITERGLPMPVDSEPVEGGTILLSHRRVGEPPTVLYQDPEQIEQLRAQHARSQAGPLRLFVSHFATCPDARRWRRTGPRGARRTTA